MKMFIFGIGLLFMICCTKNDHYHNLTRQEVKNIKQQSNYYSMYKHIQSVKLENLKNGIPVLKLSTIVFNQKYIIGVSDRVNGFVYVWDRSGKFIARVGNQGKGPGEYQGINHIYFESDSEIGILDGGLARIHLFSIDEKGIVFKDFIDIGVMFNATPSRVFLRGEKRILFFPTGYKRPAIIITNKNWRKEKEVHYYNQKSDAGYGNVIVDEEFIYITDGTSGYDDLVAHSGIVYKYSFEGVLDRKFDTKNKSFMPFPLKMDNLKKVVITEHKGYYTVYDLKFKKIHIFKDEKSRITKEFMHIPQKMYSIGDTNEFLITSELPKEKNKSLILHFFERRIPE